MTVPRFPWVVLAVLVPSALFWVLLWFGVGFLLALFSIVGMSIGLFLLYVGHQMLDQEEGHMDDALTALGLGAVAFIGFSSLLAHAVLDVVNH